MSESSSHKRAKGQATGRRGQKEVPLHGGRRLDAQTAKKAVEVERSGDPKKLEKAAGRLKSSRKSQKVLQVPQKDIPEAVRAMKKRNVSGSVKNMSGTKRRSVRKK